MRGVGFRDVENVALIQLDDPKILHPLDAIVQVQQAGLCGSDLHPYFGREAGLDPGTVMGHEFVGVVVETGQDAKKTLPKGTRVCAPFTTNCGHCYYCKSQLSARCEHSQLFGWRQNNSGLHGGQAELVRVPLAAATLLPIDDDIDNETALLLGDNLSTARFCVNMLQPERSGTYVVIGCGTVGLLTIAWALRLGIENVFAVDLVASRRKQAEVLGAKALTPGAAESEVLQSTAGRGADGVMELVGLPAAQELAYRLVRPGGTMSVIGCHCSPGFAFSPSDAYDKNLTYRTGRCPARSLMPGIAEELKSQPFDLSWCITHHFKMDAAQTAYDVFANRQDNCIKAVFDI